MLSFPNETSIFLVRSFSPIKFSDSQGLYHYLVLTHTSCVWSLTHKIWIFYVVRNFSLPVLREFLNTCSGAMRSEPSCDVGGCLFLGMINRRKLVKLRLIGYGFPVFSIRRILSAPDFHGYEIYYSCRPWIPVLPFPCSIASPCLLLHETSWAERWCKVSFRQLLEHCSKN